MGDVMLEIIATAVIVSIALVWAGIQIWRSLKRDKAKADCGSGCAVSSACGSCPVVEKGKD